jgi:tetratricopeptide (TPR) repeat protein
MSKKKKSVPVAVVTRPEKSRIWKWIVGLLALVAAAVSGYWSHYHREAVKRAQTVQTSVAQTPESTLDTLAKKNFQDAEKPVAEKLRTLLNDVKQNPSSGHSWGKLAMNLDVHGYKDEALICYRKATELAPDDYRWPYYLAILYEDRKSSEALPYFQKSLTLKDSNYAGHLRYGDALVEANRYEEAAREFVKALKMDANSAHAYVGLARISLAQNQVRDSGSLLKKAIEINPRQGEAYAMFAEVFNRLNEPDKAKQQLYISQQLPAKTPLQDELVMDLMNEGVSSKFHHMRGRAWLGQGNFQKAEEEFKLAIEASPDAKYYDSLGVTYLYEKKYSDAIAAHRKAVELNPKSVPSMNNLAAALFESGKKEEAMQILNQAIKIDPSLSYTYEHLARLNIRSNNPAEAEKVYREGLKNIPGSPDLSIQLGWLLASSTDAAIRNGAEAVQLIEPVMKQNRSPETLDVLAVAYAEAGQFDKAVDAVKQALSMTENKQAVESLNAHLKLFEAKRPYHE